MTDEGAGDLHPPAPAPRIEGGGDDIAPRPRPGFRSRPEGVSGGVKAALFAGVLRAGMGAAGLFAALLYLPIQGVTPILAGVSILMMVTGCTSTWRTVADAAADGAPALIKRLPRIVIAACCAATAATMVLTLVLGGGSLGPVAKMKADRAREASPTIRFDPEP